MINLNLWNTLLLKALTDANEHEAQAAAGRLAVRIRSSGVDLDTIQLTEMKGASRKLYEELKEEIRRYAAETGFYRKNAPGLAAKAKAAAVIQDRWGDFMDLVDERFCGADGQMPDDWSVKVRQHLKVSLRRMRRWEDGSEEIPAAIMAEIEALPVVVPRWAVNPGGAPLSASLQLPGPPAAMPAASQPPQQPSQQPAKPAARQTPPATAKPAPASKGVRVSEGQQHQIVELFLRGRGFREIEDVTLVSRSTIDRLCALSPPPPFVEVTVRQSGPPDLKEIWRLGSTLCRDANGSWIKATLRELGVSQDYRKAFGTVDLRKIDSAALQALRQKYFAAQMRKARQPEPVQD